MLFAVIYELFTQNKVCWIVTGVLY